MGLEIDMKKSNFAYDTGNNSTLLIKNDTYDVNKIKDIFDDIKNLEKKYKSEKNMAALVTDISTIMSRDETEAEEKVKEVLHTENLGSYGGLSQIQADTKTYYEYIQFKRSYFNCTGTEYDQNSGRIIKMKFEFQRTGV